MHISNRGKGPNNRYGSQPANPWSQKRSVAKTQVTFDQFLCDMTTHGDEELKG